MRKIFVIFLSVMMAISLLCACGQTSTSFSTESVASLNEEDSVFSAIEETDVMESCNLTEEEMLNTIKDYYKVFEAVMNKNGEETIVNVEENGGAIKVQALREGQEPSVLEWDTIQNAYKFLYSQGQVDLEGNLLITEETLVN